MNNDQNTPSSALRRHHLTVLLTQRGCLQGQAYQLARHIEQAFCVATSDTHNPQLTLADHALKAMVASHYYSVSQPELIVGRALELANSLAHQVEHSTLPGRQHLMRCLAVANGLLNSPEGSRATGYALARIAVATSFERAQCRRSASISLPDPYSSMASENPVCQSVMPHPEPGY